jgi:glucose/arabinose dehydrogenase
MTRTAILTALLSTAALALASCGVQATGETAANARSTPNVGTAVAAPTGAPFTITAHGSFDEPWAADFAPSTSVLFITERPGTMKFVDLKTGREGTVTGLPKVDYGGQGGLGDVAFLPNETSAPLNKRTIYLSWVEAGTSDTCGAVVGRGTLICAEADACRIEGLSVVWRQNPKVSGRGHFSHRIAFAPDGKTMFVSSGERQKFTPAQDLKANLGKVVHLNLDGTPAAGGPFVARGGLPELWSIGHRNLLGLQFDAQGRLWDLEHGPKGGDELNLVKPGQNYGWPAVSNGDHYDGKAIPRHATRPDFAAPAISWNPVIAPGDFTFYSGKLWPEWKGNAVIGGMSPTVLVRVAIEGERAREVARYPMDKRIREVVEGPDGALWLLEDGEGGRLLELRPR